MSGKAVNVPGLEPGIRVRTPKRQISTPSRHSAKCRICNHPDRAAIEFDFLNWRNPFDLVKSYHFRGLSTIYRHAHATGLFAKRRLNLRFAMERIVERVNEVPVTATAVIRAARAITRINDEGQWVDPPSHLVIHREDSSPVGAGLALPAPAQQAKPSCGTGSQPVDPSFEVQMRRRRSSIFDPALLDEPSESANAAGEMPKIPGVPGRAAQEEVILTITPELYRCREERWRAIEADRQARAESGSRSGGFTPPASPSSGEAEGAAPAIPGLWKGTASAVPSPTPQKEQSVASSPSSLPQAAFPNSAPPALTSSASRDAMAARAEDLVAPPSSTLPPARRGGEAAPVKPATACPEQGRGAKQSPPAASPPLGSSGTSDPPFPFIPRVPLRHHARRHFLIANETHSRGESND